MCSASKPKVEHSPPPPMAIPVVENDEVQRKRNRERQRAASAYGREATILGGGLGGSGAVVGGPTSQQKTLLGS